MKRLGLFVLLAAFAVLSAPALRAQWKTETYTLRAGWNGIYLQGDASYATLDQLFAAYPTVDQVWRWNPNPNQVQFSTSPAVPDATSSEWTVWNRNDPAEQQLTKMIGQSAYLIHCTGTAGTTISVALAQKPMPPDATWLITGANFMGFPVDPSSSATTFSNYFASFPVAITTPAKVYKYVGGELGPANPIQVSSFGTEKVDRNTAYWFQAATVGDFTGLVEYELPSTAGLAFGRTTQAITAGVMNRSNVAITLTVSTVASEPAPAGQAGISGAVPLTHRILDSTSGAYTDTPIVGSFTVSVPANGRLDLNFGIDRSQLGTSAGALYASLVRIKDSANLTDVYLPVTAQPSTPAGLWVGEINVSSVVSTIAGSPGSTTSRAFPLRLLLHVDNGGTPRILSQAFVGNLAATGHAPGICTHEGGLWADTKADALRLIASQMPLDRVIAGTGAVALGNTVSYTVSLPFDDVTNPFVHTYHPDHDNKDARGAPLAAGVESYNITRTITLTFTATPPDGSTVSGWGSTVYGGTYAETITGLSRLPLTVGGTFGMRRVSEVGDLDTTTQ